MSGNYNQHSLSSLSSVSGSGYYSGGSSQYGGGSGYYYSSGQYNSFMQPTYGLGAPLANPTKPVRPFFSTTEGLYKLIKELPLPKRDPRNKSIPNPSKITFFYQPGRFGVVINTASNSNTSSLSSSVTPSITIKNSQSNNTSTSTPSSLSNASYSSSSSSYSEQSEQHSSTSSVVYKPNGSANSNNNKKVIQANDNEVFRLNLINGEFLSSYNFTNIDETAFEDKIFQVTNLNKSHERDAGLPTCVKFNKKRSSHDNKLQILIGMESGDIYYLDPTSERKSVCIRPKCKSTVIGEKPDFNYRCTYLEWLPNNPNQFLASFSNGTLCLVDVSKENFNPEFYSTTFYLNNNSKEFYVKLAADSRCNIVSEWKISKKSANSFCFSPCSRLVAVACQDGYLHIYNIENYQSVVSFKSYFGGFLSVDWSPDGKYIVTGGEDDYISIWSFEEEKLIARGQGHQSWVGCVKFDHFIFNSDQDHNKYRILSGGEDTKLLLWDFSKESLKKPKVKTTPTSTGSQNDQQLPPPPQQQLPSYISTETGCNKVVQSRSRMECPLILPVVSHRVGSEPVSDLMFTKDWIITVSNTKVCLWARPDTVANAQKIDSLYLPNTPASYTKKMMMDGNWK